MINYKKIHFVGIGGIGMSALARFFKDHGVTVSGSDNCESELLNQLKEEEITLFGSHDMNNINEDYDLIIKSEAVPLDNVELKKANQLQIPIFTYFEVLGEVSKDYFTIAVCGTHGKTTTTAMLSLALIEAGFDPNVIVGTKISEFGNSNYRKGASNILLVEACEYRRSFLNLQPNIILITNIEAEHLDYYKDINDYKSAFIEFADKLSTDGVLFINGDDKESIDIHGKLNVEKYLFGTINQNRDYIMKENSVFYKNAKLIELKLKVIGDFNKMNALASVSVCNHLKADMMRVQSAINNFKGTWRRFEFKGNYGDIPIYDDYAHHPSEIRATLRAVKENFSDMRICLVFQPHQFSRTKKLLDEFIGSFNDADLLVIPNIYRVRDSDNDVKSLSALELVNKIKTNNPNVFFKDGFEQTVDFLKANLKKGDLLLTMGAGDVWKVGEMMN